jgi:biopolymer transport protein ExbD
MVRDRTGLLAAALAATTVLGCGNSSSAPSTPTSSSASAPGATASIAPTSAPAPAPVTVRLIVTKDGKLVFDDKPVEATELTARARESAKSRRLKVVVAADKDAAYQHVIGAVDKLREAGITEIAFATAPPGGTSAEGAPPKSPSGFRTGPPPDPRAKPIEEAAKWQCPFPPFAERGGMKDANVLVKVNVDETGKASSVDVLEDPGGGYAKAAKDCAMEKKYEAAKDDSGKTVKASTFPFWIHFVVK